jgi:hypothetical protein
MSVSMSPAFVRFADIALLKAFARAGASSILFTRLEPIRMKRHPA